ncbi:MAG TPA: hypothetical protein VGS07_33890 [Thermoanaerobaculia bacterium]|jgi:hypothetical protein|nr:hypothetical protein [Thermoanaerobaculia bacterium]
MSRKIRCLAAALALVLLSAGAAQARSIQSPSGSPGFLDALWQWLAGRYAPGLSAIWEKEGSSMDPDGRTLHLSGPPPTTDEGGSMDPNGRS